MKPALLSGSRLVFGVVVLLMLIALVRTVTAAPATQPRAQDIARAATEVTPAAGLDERFARPPGYTLSGNGVVEPRQRETRLAASVKARVVVVHVVEGQQVTLGEPVVQLEAEVERAALAVAEADLAAAEAERDKALAGVRTQDLDAATALAKAAKARAALSQGVLERIQPLANTGYASADELDRAKQQAEADAGAYAEAEARRQAAVAGSRREDIAAAKARYQAANARRDEAAARLAQRTVRSPLAGTVLQVLVRPGEFQAPEGEPLVVIGDTSALRVRLDIDERYVGRVQVGDQALVRAIAFPGRDFEAHVVEVGLRMGRKNVRTDDPIERNDTKVLEVVLQLKDAHDLVIGQRVVGYVLGRHKVAG